MGQLANLFLRSFILPIFTATRKHISRQQQQKNMMKFKPFVLLSNLSLNCIEGSSKRFPTKSFQLNASILLLQHNSRVAICLRLFQLPFVITFEFEVAQTENATMRTMHQFKSSV